MTETMLPVAIDQCCLYIALRIMFCLDVAVTDVLQPGWGIEEVEKEWSIVKYSFLEMKSLG